MPNGLVQKLNPMNRVMKNMGQARPDPTYDRTTGSIRNKEINTQKYSSGQKGPSQGTGRGPAMDH